MIEAVNSTLTNAQLLRGAAEAAASSTRSFAANPDRVQEAASAPQAPYVSPYIALDLNYDKAVLQIRDRDTGDVVRQFPSESRLAADQRRVSAEREAGGIFIAAQQQASKTGASSTGDTSRIGVSDIGSGDNGAAAAADVAQAQIASQALTAGAQTSAPNNLSAGVSVLA
jgi:hypothetical protein